MSRKVLDCKDSPFYGQTCDLRVIGEERIILPLMTHHVINEHGDGKDSPQLQEALKAMLKDE
jgi:hypothetical protein